MSRSERIVQLLGMSHGAAAGKLRKNILFSLLVRLKENVCFRCGKEISFSDDLSIEHKEPWEGISAELFWDLSNIAFSHLVCNFRAGRRDTPVRTEGQKKSGYTRSRNSSAPNGTSWCFGHKRFLSVECFGKNEFRSSGVQKYCYECRQSPTRTGLPRSSSG